MTGIHASSIGINGNTNPNCCEPANMATAPRPIGTMSSNRGVAA